MTSSSNPHYLTLHRSDNVAVVLSDDGPIPRGHKVALFDIPKNAPILKLGNLIAVATENISKEQHVHIHNTRPPSPEELSHNSYLAPTSSKYLDQIPKNLMAYPRDRGRAGFRNYISVVAPVNCSATVVKRICRHFENSPKLKKKNIDGIVPVTYFGGCALDTEGSYHKLLSRTLAGWIFHPNVVGSLVVGLGCEGVRMQDLLDNAPPDQVRSAIPLLNFDIQSCTGTQAAISRGIEVLENLVDELPIYSRHPVPWANMCLALNCGGSDAFSAITANPLVGLVTDLISDLGGAAILAEIPECHGAEEMLLARLADKESEPKLRQIFDNWKQSASSQGVSLNNNLAKGNIAGGLTTIVEKSLGAVIKGGTRKISSVTDYAEAIESPGVGIMNTPGYDPASVTGLVAGGCNLVVFTTGKGSVYGCGISPTLKVATTSQLFNRMRGDMDFDAGRVLSEKNLDQLSYELLSQLIAVAEGKASASELLGLGGEEFVPWPKGETL